jgi:hypothetical protein
MVDDLQRGVVRTLLQSGRPGRHRWRADEAAGQNVDGQTSELADNTRSTQRQNMRARMASKMSAQTPMPTKSCVSWNSSLFRYALLESNI